MTCKDCIYYNEPPHELAGVPAVCSNSKSTVSGMFVNADFETCCDFKIKEDYDGK